MHGVALRRRGYTGLPAGRRVETLTHSMAQ